MAGERRPGRPRTIDRVEAVQIAMRSWWAEGVEAVSLNEISRRTGLSKSSLYREFGGEDGLMVAALEQYRTLSALPLLELFEPPAEPVDQLAKVVMATTMEHGLPPGCFFTKLRLTKATLGEATQSLVAKMVEERLATFERWYRSVLEQGLAAPDLSATQAARYIDAQLTLILVRLAAGDVLESVRQDATLALSVVLGSRVE
ncbi:MAG: TetR family transcriptional regulator [Myxococcota bacterium]